MTQRLALLLCLGMLNARSTRLLATDNAEDGGYFADATDCYRAAIIKTQVTIPVGGFSNKDMTIAPQYMNIDVPITYDPGSFSNCMAHAGHTPPQADPKDYLKMSGRCLDEARQAENPDEAYGRCIRHGNINIETIIHKKVE